MSSFAIKIVLMLFMFGDHLAAALTFSDVLSAEIITILRGAGRFVFPVYAYLCAVGFHHSKNRKNYLTSLLLFAAVAQIPFLMLKATVPGGFPLNMLFNFSINTNALFQYLPIYIILLFCYYKYLSKKIVDILVVAISLAAAAVTLSVSGSRFLTLDLNVLYTFAVAVVIMLAIEVYSKGTMPVLDSLFILVVAFLSLLFIGIYSDYSIIGIMLVFAVYLCKNSKSKSIVAVAFFCLLQYAATPLFLALSLISVVIILLYNGKRGYSLYKYIFYAYYPAHLAVIGAIRFLI